MSPDIGRCRCCGASAEESNPHLAQMLREHEAVTEYHDRWGLDGPPNALEHLAESRGLPLVEVVEAAARDQLSRVVQMPPVRRAKR